MQSLPQRGSAAVAIITCRTPKESILVLRRAAHPDDPWSGHFSFPGGRKERGDEDLMATCIRETREETGILLKPADFHKQLPLEPAGRNFNSPIWVQPYIFTLHKPPPISIDPIEIQAGYWLDIEQFSNTQLHRQIEMLPGRHFPAFPLNDYYVWGFTYRLLSTILDLKV